MPLPIASMVDVVGALQYGLAGLAFALATLSYRLLAAESRKDKPSQSILKSIRAFGAFCMLLTVAVIAQPLLPDVSALKEQLAASTKARDNATEKLAESDKALSTTVVERDACRDQLAVTRTELDSTRARLSDVVAEKDALDAERERTGLLLVKSETVLQIITDVAKIKTVGVDVATLGTNVRDLCIKAKDWDRIDAEYTDLKRERKEIEDVLRAANAEQGTKLGEQVATLVAHLGSKTAECERLDERSKHLAESLAAEKQARASESRKAAEEVESLRKLLQERDGALRSLGGVPQILNDRAAATAKPIDTVAVEATAILQSEFASEKTREALLLDLMKSKSELAMAKDESAANKAALQTFKPIIDLVRSRAATAQQSEAYVAQLVREQLVAVPDAQRQLDECQRASVSLSNTIKSLQTQVSALENPPNVSIEVNVDPITRGKFAIEASVLVDGEDVNEPLDNTDDDFNRATFEVTRGREHRIQVDVDVYGFTFGAKNFEPLQRKTLTKTITPTKPMTFKLAADGPNVTLTER